MQLLTLLIRQKKLPVKPWTPLKKPLPTLPMLLRTQPTLLPKR
jgi:hypothetical protein